MNSPWSQNYLVNVPFGIYTLGINHCHVYMVFTTQVVAELLIWDLLFVNDHILWQNVIFHDALSFFITCFNWLRLILRFMHNEGVNLVAISSEAVIITWY